MLAEVDRLTGVANRYRPDSCAGAQPSFFISIQCDVGYAAGGLRPGHLDALIEFTFDPFLCFFRQRVAEFSAIAAAHDKDAEEKIGLLIGRARG